MKCERAVIALGTNVRIVLDLADDKAFISAFKEILRIDEKFSRFREGNELWRLNQNLGRWVCVSEELFYLIESGEKVRIRSGGVFDLGVKNILEKLGYDRDYSLVGKDFAAGGRDGTMEGQRGPDLCEIEMRRKDLSIKISRPIDLGGLGKGYALDRVRDILEKQGLDSFLIDCGGDIFATGGSSRNWKVAFENPLDPNEAIGFTFVDGFYLASSSANRRVWGAGENRKHHLVDMRTLSSANEMVATYVQCGTGILADAWATALFVMGFEEAKKVLSGQKTSDGLEAMLVSNEGVIFRSGGFKGELFL